MLLIVTIVLVLVAAVTLLIGIFTDNLALIFISIGASAVAAIVLAVLSQVSRRRDRSIGPPAQGRSPVARPPTPPAPAERPTPGGYTPPTPAYQPPAPPAPRPAARPEPVATTADEERTSVLPVATATAPAADKLPIARYDSMRVSQVLKQLDDLDLDQLEEIAQYEEVNKNRTTVLDRIDDLMDELEGPEAAGAPPEASAAEPTEPEPTEAGPTEPELAEPAAVEPVPVEAVASAGGGFPIPDYDSLDEDEIIDVLGDLDVDELEAVADREESGQNRASVLDAIDDRLDVLEGLVPTPPPAPVAVPAAPARKAASRSAGQAPAKRAAGKRTPAKKAARAKKAAPAKEAAPAKKAAKRSTPAKKAAPARAAKAPARKPAPAKKAAPARVAKAPAKKAAATKGSKKAAGTAKATPTKRSAKKA